MAPQPWQRWQLFDFCCLARQNFVFTPQKKVIIKVDSIFVFVTEYVLWLFRFVHGCCLFVIINESSGALKINLVLRIIHQIKDYYFNSLMINYYFIHYGPFLLLLVFTIHTYYCKARMQLTICRAGKYLTNTMGGNQVQ